MLSGSTIVKAVHRTLIKLTQGVNFTNILQVAFALEDPKSAKITDDLTAFFTLLGSAHAKALSKMLVKSTQDLSKHVLRVFFRRSWRYQPTPLNVRLFTFHVKCLRVCSDFQLTNLIIFFLKIQKIDFNALASQCFTATFKVFGHYF